MESQLADFNPTRTHNPVRLIYQPSYFQVTFADGRGHPHQRKDSNSLIQ